MLSYSWAFGQDFITRKGVPSSGAELKSNQKVVGYPQTAVSLLHECAYIS